MVKQGDRATICKLDLYGLDDELEILSCNPDTIELSEKVRAKVGSDDPDIWMPVFLDEVKQQKRKRETQST